VVDRPVEGVDGAIGALEAVARIGFAAGGQRRAAAEQQCRGKRRADGQFVYSHGGRSSSGSSDPSDGFFALDV